MITWWVVEVGATQPIHVSDRLAALMIMDSSASVTIADSCVRSNLAAHFLSIIVDLDADHISDLTVDLISDYYEDLI